MAGMSLTHVCTLLSQSENPASVEQIASEFGCRWVWLPIAGGNLQTLQALEVEPMLTKLAESIGATSNPRIYLHCSAGIHRTGFFASLMLRLQLTDVVDVPGALATLRPVTAEQVGPERIALAMARADALLEKESAATLRCEGCRSHYEATRT
jgi:protein-tyrosine phosphatase